MGQILEYIKIALMNIRSNKGRSALTMLGIIIGIAAVIMIISVGNGLHASVSGELNDLGGGLIYLGIDSSKTDRKLRADDLAALRESVAHIRGFSPAFGTFSGSARSRKRECTAFIDSGTEDLILQSPDKIVRGRYFDRNDVEKASPVCVVRRSDTDLLFGTDDVIGLELDVTVRGVTRQLRIIGIRENSSSQLVNMVVSGERFCSLEVPYTLTGQMLGISTDTFDSVYIFAEPENSTQVATKSITFLENRLGLRGQDALRIQSFQDISSQFDSILGTVTLFIALVAAISLLVGGIGVMNIMLVSVTERTREIGIRKALGARTGSILLQFLAEAGIITSIGGIIGIILGLAGAAVICGIIGFTPSVSVGVILAATLFSMAVGIFFGIYPARKAARLNPIEALRHE